MIHVLAVADLYSYILWMKKIYGLAYIYSTRNFYYGRAMIAASGIDAESIITNLANFRYWLNTYINKTAAYVVPDSINLFKRRAFIYSDVYTESETGNVKDQLYTFTPDGFFKFDFDSVGAGMLKYVNIDKGHMYTFEELCALGESLFENISQDEDFGLMSGDLLKAFGTQIIKVDPLGEDYVIDPHFDHEVLHQIMNASIMGAFGSEELTSSRKYAYYDDPTDQESKWGNRSFESGNVYQLPNGVLVHAFIEANNIHHGGTDFDLWMEIMRYSNVLLNTDLPQVEPEHIMEMTRLTATMMQAPTNWRYFKAEASSEAARTISYVSCGSDLVTQIDILQFDDAGNLHIPGSKLSKYIITEPFIERVPQIEGLYTLIENVQRKINFKYLPIMYELLNDPAAAEVRVPNIWQNLDNYTLIEPVQLDRIHRVAMYSLAHVPGVSRNINS
jgi:hypothetical protein